MRDLDMSRKRLSFGYSEGPSHARGQIACEGKRGMINGVDEKLSFITP